MEQREMGKQSMRRKKKKKEWLKETGFGVFECQDLLLALFTQKEKD